MMMTDAALRKHGSRLIDPRKLPVAWQVGVVAAGTMYLALSSQIAVPLVPVPVTMQTFAVLLVGALYGTRLGTITTVAWLIEDSLGLPVFANGAAGVAHLIGKTGGYLLAFPVACAVVGWLVERGWNCNRALLAFAAMIIGHVVCIGLGAAWLAAFVGSTLAVASGVMPFIVGSLLKSALGTAVLKILTPTKRKHAA